MANIARRANQGTTFNATSGSITIPSSVVAGDGMIIAITWNSGVASTATTTSGWTQQGTDHTVGTRTTRILKKQAVSGSPGSTFTVTLNASAKCTVSFVAYQNLDVSIIDVMTTKDDAGNVTTHPAASATTTQSGEWGLVIWVDKTSSPGTRTPPASLTLVRTDIATGSGACSQLLADTNGAIP